LRSRPSTRLSAIRCSRNRSPHQALDALATGILRRKVSWVLDADIRGFYDAIDHGWLLQFLEHRIADKRVLRLIRKWLRRE
jgi:RNA-directed DNA polymerase